MMLTLVAASAMAMGVYQFDATTKLDYDVAVVFNGFLPLLGGNEGKAEVNMGVRVVGLSKEAGSLRASSELTAFDIKFNGAKLPLDIESAKGYFPKTTVSMTPGGKVLKSDAPNIMLPVRLPGLDVKRFPDITYLPIELDGNELKLGGKWEFSRIFGDSPMQYSCTVSEMKGDLATIAVTVKQEYEVLEDESLEVVKSEKDAVSRVKTVLNGSGTVVFDAAKGAARTVAMKNSSVSTVTSISDGSKTERKLDSTLNVKLKGIADPAVKPAANTTKPATPPTLIDQAGNLWNSAVKAGQNAWQTGAGYVSLARMAFGMFAAQIPGLQPFLKQIMGG
ncbi:MAG: hypothetical protein KF836_00100 [Fimbriimonadaceae bacterium]|nr:hypothetical protein [Fimbriimonadaceae bacterium]